MSAVRSGETEWISAPGEPRRRGCVSIYLCSFRLLCPPSRLLLCSTTAILRYGPSTIQLAMWCIVDSNRCNVIALFIAWGGEDGEGVGSIWPLSTGRIVKGQEAPWLRLGEEPGGQLEGPRCQYGLHNRAT